jgi:ABC-type nitrate/sulfonate/bicarbonate transport system permease component
VTAAAERPAVRPAPSRWPRPSRSATISIAAVAVFLLLWQVTPELGLVNGRFTSQPTLVLQAAWDVAFADDFLRHARISLTAFVVGYGLAMVVSIPLGIVLGTSRIARHMLEPPLMALYIAPTLILLPVMIVWLGIGIASKIAVAFLGAVFPIIVNTMAGMREADHRLVRMAQSFGASRFDVFTRILVPGALPSIVVGLRLAIGRAVLGVIVGELYVSQAGLGFQLTTYGAAMRIDRLLVYAIAVSIFGYTMTALVRAIEVRVQRWKPQ